MDGTRGPYDCRVDVWFLPEGPGIHRRDEEFEKVGGVSGEDGDLGGKLRGMSSYQRTLPGPSLIKNDVPREGPFEFLT